MKKSSFESIIPTALLTAYPLIFTDIPYANEFYNELCKFGFPEKLKNDKLVFELEARHILIDDLLKKSKINQVLELACGFTGEGIDRCKKNENMVCVEFDLPKVIKAKKKMIKNFTDIPQNLHFVAGNALNMNDLKKCLKHFDMSKPIAVVNQGLMRYLDFEEKETLARNVYEIISGNCGGGIWITCDITPAKFIKNEDKNMDKFNEKLTETTDRNNASWRFENKKHVNDFMGKIGFSVEWHDFVEVNDKLTSRKRFKLTAEETKKYLENANVGVMRKK